MSSSEIELMKRVDPNLISYDGRCNNANSQKLSYCKNGQQWNLYSTVFLLVVKHWCHQTRATLHLRPSLLLVIFVSLSLSPFLSSLISAIHPLHPLLPTKSVLSQCIPHLKSIYWWAQKLLHFTIQGSLLSLGKSKVSGHWCLSWCWCCSILVANQWDCFIILWYSEEEEGYAAPFTRTNVLSIEFSAFVSSQ